VSQILLTTTTIFFTGLFVFCEVHSLYKERSIYTTETLYSL